MQAASLRELCSQIAAEKDSKKLINLIAELRLLLAEQYAESENRSSGKPHFGTARDN